jgi:hypothetical protein
MGLLPVLFILASCGNRAAEESEPVYPLIHAINFSGPSKQEDCDRLIEKAGAGNTELLKGLLYYNSGDIHVHQEGKALIEKNAQEDDRVKALGL